MHPHQRVHDSQLQTAVGLCAAASAVFEFLGWDARHREAAAASRLLDGMWPSAGASYDGSRVVEG